MLYMHEIVVNINTTLIGFSLSGLLISRANIRTKSSGIIPRLSWEIRFIQINLNITLFNSRDLVTRNLQFYTKAYREATN